MSGPDWLVVDRLLLLEVVLAVLVSVCLTVGHPVTAGVLAGVFLVVLAGDLCSKEDR